MYRPMNAIVGVIVLGLSLSASANTLALESAGEEAPLPQPDAEDSQEIGVVLGATVGGPLSPGGLSIDGHYLYRLSDLDWLETSVGFSLGSGDAECYRDRSSEFVCDHGLVDGFGGEGSIGVRRYFSGQKEFRPFMRLGLGLRLVSFSGDDVLGAAIPVVIGGGVRAEVANRVLVIAEANFRAGPAFLNQNLGIEPMTALSIGAGVEFTLE